MNAAQHLAELKRQRATYAASGMDDLVEDIDRQIAEAKVAAGNGRPAPVDQPGGIVNPPYPGDQPALDTSGNVTEPAGGTVPQTAETPDVHSLPQAEVVDPGAAPDAPEAPDAEPVDEPAPAPEPVAEPVVEPAPAEGGKGK